MGTPYVSREGKQAARQAERRAGMGGWQKRRPSGHGMDRGGASGDITRRESGLTSIWSGITRDCGQSPQERRQMTAVATRTGALSSRLTVRRLQARMVKVVSQHVFDVASPRSARGVCQA
jgi:hypothetical protein